MEGWEVEARLGIEDTVSRYVRFADGGHAVALGALFADDGVLMTDTDEVRGPTAIEQYIEAARASLAASATGGGRIRHHVSSLRIDLRSRDEARATCYFLAVTAAGPDHWGTYRDRLVRTGPHWLFAERIATVEGRAAGSWAAERADGAS